MSKASEWAKTRKKGDRVLAYRTQYGRISVVPPSKRRRLRVRIETPKQNVPV